MKRSPAIVAILFFIATVAFGQANSVSGKITEVRSFNDQYAITVANTMLVLKKDMNDKTGKSFEINNAYKDILIKTGNTYKLNPAYSGKSFKIVYYINGKGWKCIQTIEPIN